MALKAPLFWYKRRSFWPFFLFPFAKIWQWAGRKRMQKNGYDASIPVICVGNINMGGVGKTPTVIWLVQELNALGKNPLILTRGFGGREKGPTEVTASQTAEDVGDEALLLSMFASVVVAKNRAEGARFAENLGADIIIMDDGFQNPDLKKDISIIVLDGEIGLGNGQIFPAGPLRESLSDASERADCFLLIGEDRKEIANRILGKPIVKAEIKPIEMGLDWRDQAVVAFAGIGRPEKFFATLQKLGARLVKKIALGDHQKISMHLLTRLEKEAKSANAKLVTTEKDAARLPTNWRGEVVSLPVRLVPHESHPDQMKNILQNLF